MNYSNIPSAKNLVLHFKSWGIKHIIISPGSRNAPLILSFTSDPFFECYSIVDERCAAFFALGMAQNLDEPTAVVCTSGSALLNYYPAVAEAFYSNIPLVVVSADRPPYKIDVGDGQTIRQNDVFKRNIGCSVNLKLDVSHATEAISQFKPELLKEDQKAIEKYNTNELVMALAYITDKKLPIHINIPFEEPLYGIETLDTNIRLPLKKMNLMAQGVIPDMEMFRTTWANGKKKMVLVGVNHPNAIAQELLDKLAQDPSVVVFTETTSNLHHCNFFPSIDSIIFPIEKSPNRVEEFKKLQPEILLTFGGLVVSKKVKAFLRAYQPKHHWHINENRAYDTYFSLTNHVETSPQNFLEKLLMHQATNESDYFKFWNSVKENYESKRAKYLQKIGFSDFLVFSEVLPNIPNQYQLHLSNSSTVRYAQLFDIPKSVKVYCNRGTSGIDGSTSTAIGSALHEEQPTLLITGDLSFLYDSNAFWNPYLRNDFRIILINNGGGGIFKILPGNDNSERFERYFETKHQYSAEHLCSHYGLDYYSCYDQSTLKKALRTYYNPSDKPAVLEVFTDGCENDKILLAYFDFIS